jgi:hypothetical protein
LAARGKCRDDGVPHDRLVLYIHPLA